MSNLHGIDEPLAKVAFDEFKRKIVGIDGGIGFLLPAVGAEGLLKISLSVEKTDCDERNTQVARRFDMVAGENAESAGVDRNGLV